MIMIRLNPKKRHGKNYILGSGRLTPQREGAYVRYLIGGKFDTRKAIEDLAGTIFDPIIVWKGMEDPSLLPKWLKDQITLDRMIEEQKPHPTGTDSEALAFLMTASLAVPPGRLMHDLYIYLFEKEMKKFGNKMPGDFPQIDKLSLSEEAELARLKRWIYEQRLEYRKRRWGKANPDIAWHAQRARTYSEEAGNAGADSPLGHYLSGKAWGHESYAHFEHEKNGAIADHLEIYRTYRDMYNRAVREGKPAKELAILRGLVDADIESLRGMGLTDRQIRELNPIHRVPGGGWQWGHRGKIYRERWKAVRQAAAAHANGFVEKNPVPEALTMRLADKAMALSDGDVKGTVQWLKSLGCKVVSSGGPDVYNIEGLAGVRAGIYGGLDPVTAAVQLGFLLAGMYWPMVYPSLLKEVNRRWKERRTQTWHRGPLPH